jgi:CRISPR/Cas system-associated exonuclease Cas4 (RecB family)
MSKSIVGSLRFKKQEGFDYHEFAKLVETAYESTKRDGTGTLKKTFSPSTIGYGHGNCPRYWFIAFNGADFEDTFDAGAIANMMNGTYAHERLQKIIAMTGVLKEEEREILNDDPPIRGFADLIIEWDGKEVVGEIKTTKEEQYLIKQASMKASGNHLLQILTYMKVTGADQGFLMYENKNTQEICIIPVNMNERNQKLIDDTFDWMREVYKAYTEDTLPTRSYTKSVYACKNCPVKTKCWKEMEDGDITITAMVAPK